MAVNLVYHTYEQAEDTLLRLPLDQLLLSITVSPQWQAVIQSSAAIRERLLRDAQNAKASLLRIPQFDGVDMNVTGQEYNAGPSRTWLFAASFLEGTLFVARQDGFEVFVLIPQLPELPVVVPNPFQRRFSFDNTTDTWRVMLTSADGSITLDVILQDSDIAVHDFYSYLMTFYWPESRLGSHWWDAIDCSRTRHALVLCKAIEEAAVQGSSRRGSSA